jgi:hypothetical protein
MIEMDARGGNAAFVDSAFLGYPINVRPHRMYLLDNERRWHLALSASKPGVKTMMSKSKLALIAALAAVSIASPAFAQSFDRTGSILPHYYDASGTMVWGAWGPPQAPATINHRVARSARDLHMNARSGAGAFAAVPLTTRSDSNSNSRTLTCGGSPGYNQNLYNY